jgi:hypothetical protein
MVESSRVTSRRGLDVTLELSTNGIPLGLRPRGIPTVRRFRTRSCVSVPAPADE